jgi:hypothetical protein
MCKKFWLESQKGRDHSEDLGIDGRIILKRILRKIRIQVLTALGMKTTVFWDVVPCNLVIVYRR